MCKPMSGVLTRERVFWSKSHDSHEQIISENSLGHLDGIDVQLVRYEITPLDGNYAAPFKKWVYRVDQDKLPPWYSAEWAEGVARKELPKWAKHHLLRGNSKYVVGPDEQRFVLSGSPTITMQTGCGEVWTYGTSTPRITMQTGCGGVVAYGTSTPRITMQTGCGEVWTYGTSSPRITMQTGCGGVVTYDTSSPRITMQTGCGGVVTYDTSSPVIVKRKAKK